MRLRMNKNESTRSFDPYTYLSLSNPSVSSSDQQTVIAATLPLHVLAYVCVWELVCVSQCYVLQILLTFITSIRHLCCWLALIMIAELTFSGNENSPPKVGTIDKINTCTIVKKGHSIVHVCTYQHTQQVKRLIALVRMKNGMVFYLYNK